MMAIYSRITCVLLLSCAQPSVMAQTETQTETQNDAVTVTGKAQAGMEYQSNVNISELEQASGASDSATVLEAEINLGWQASEALRFDTGYSINDKRYQDASDYDTRLQLAFIDSNYRFDNMNLGANFYHAKADLAQRDFMSLNQYSLYSMHNLSDTWYLRPSVKRSEKTFAQLESRDASNNGANLDSYWFFDQGQRFVSVGLSYEDEAAQDNGFSYRAKGVSVRASSKFDLWQLAQQLQLGMKLSLRDYAQGIDGASRDDLHQQFDAKWTLNINSHFAVVTSLEYGDYQSVLDSANYNETRAGLMLQVSF